MSRPEEHTPSSAEPPRSAELDRLDARIAWVLAHPGTSAWLRHALSEAIGAEPTVNSNDLEMLRHLLLPRAVALSERAVTPVR